MAPRLRSGSRVLSSLVLLLAACACFSQPQLVAARLLEGQPALSQIGTGLQSAETAAGAKAAALAVTAEDPIPLKAPLKASTGSSSGSTPATSRQKLPATKSAAAQQRPARGGSIPASKPGAASSTAAVVGTPAAATVRQRSSKAAAKAGSHVTEGLPPMIPLPLLLDDCQYTNPQLSPDGKRLAYIKPDAKSGTANIFVRNLPPQGARPAQAEGFESEISIFARDGTDSDVQITFDTDQGVASYAWTEDGSNVFYVQDEDGDENFHLYLSSVNNPAAAIDLTPFPGVKAEGIVSSERFPDRMFIGLNKRDPSVFDMYSLDLNTLTLTLHTVNPGQVSSWHMDWDFQIRGADGYDNTNGASYVIINDALPKLTPRTTLAWRQAEQSAMANKRVAMPLPTKANFKALEAMFARAEIEQWGFKEWVAASSSKSDVSKWRRLITWPFGEEGGVFRFSTAGDALYVVSSIGRDTTELQLISTAPGAKVLKRIASNPLANVNSVEFNQHTWEPQIVSYDYLKVQWKLLDPALKAEWSRIEAFRPGEEVSIVDRAFDEKVWILGFTSDSVNSKYYLHRPGTWPPELLFDTQPSLLPYSTSKMHGVVIKARDGLKLPAYLTLPVKRNVPSTLPKCVTGNVPDLRDRTPRREVAFERSEVKSKECSLGLDLPMVLYVHGGPWSRDTWGADPTAQLLANRGYAVLQVNYRASTGYGKRFMNLGDKQWGVGTMQHDLTDSVEWAIARGIADPKKVCIMGGSYGGYATLAGLAFTPELYACGIDLVGISNVGTFMSTIPPYWEPLRYEWATRVGPADTDDAFNRRISPLFHVDKIRSPLFIAQGAHDPRVPQAESDQMFKAMFTKGLPVKYVLYTDEGHGIARPDNRMDYYSRIEQFFAEHLGGRAEAPLAIKGVSAVVVKDLGVLAAVAPKKAAKSDAPEAALQVSGSGKVKGGSG